MEGEYRREGGDMVRRWKSDWMVGKRVEGGREPSRREEKGKARRRRSERWGAEQKGMRLRSSGSGGKEWREEGVRRTRAGSNELLFLLLLLLLLLLLRLRTSTRRRS